MHQKNFEFVTFRAFRAHVPYVVPTCLTYLYVSRAYVPSCLKLLRPYVPRYPKSLRGYVPTSLELLRAYVATCLRILFFHVPIYSCMPI